ncbi:hypothetical protein CSC74_11990 [Pseudoxanthomonas yeongjuensis]|uniref:hypothetical protein n=1 Tax=Pseudoxanthomonas yeongjuensis TaxID=377616 RepID=UPI001391DCB2|nr:hypothetical protein [Pseudoxanthomonas yeongjuensis]KAF1715885.1 hypothetical protein CSC74_11990 [Pseudoxanthomonas yeongjuensis]
MRACIAAAWVLAAAYLAAGLATLWLSPRVPYADAWRFLARFLRVSGPAGVVTPDNGHYELLPNLVRVLELRHFAANQSLQIAVSMALLLAICVVTWRILRGLASASRAAAVLAMALGLFWLGNVRALGHAHDALHVYCVVLALALGLQALVNAQRANGIRAAGVAAICGGFAAMSFGSGIAVFVGFAAVLVVHGSNVRGWLVLSAGLIASLLTLRLGDGTDTAIAFAPSAQAELLLRWLAGPFVFAGWPLFDPGVAAHIPSAAVRGPAEAIAQAYAGAFGPVMLARWPHLLVGAMGVAWLGFESWRACRSKQAPALFGIGVAWFSLAVGGLIAVVRYTYFKDFPDQLLAPRYVVWSSLFWAGLGMAAVVHAKRPAIALGQVMMVAILLVPSQAWMAKLGGGMRDIAERTALAATAGVLETGLPLGENVPGELADALPGLRRANAAAFAWPEAGMLGKSVPMGTRYLAEARDIQVATVGNRLGDRGRRVSFVLGDIVPSGDRLLLVDADGTARGLAMRDPENRARWIGWMSGEGDGAVPWVASLPTP